MRYRIHHRFLILFGGLFFLYCLILAIIAYIDRQRMVEYGKSVYREREVLLNSSIALMSRPLELFVYDYSYWDEMLQFVRQPDSGWAYANLETVIPNFQVQCVWVFNEHHNCVYFTGNERYRNFPLPDSALMQLRAKNYFSHFFIWQDSVLLEITGAPIQPTADIQRVTPPQGAFFAARIWDQARLNQLEEINNGKIWIAKPSFQDIRSAFDEEIHVHKFLSGWDHAPVALVHCVSPNPVMIQLQLFTRYQWIILIVFSLISMVAVIYYIRRWVIQPVKQLSVALEQGHDRNLKSLPMPAEEFCRLSDLIQQFFAQRDQLSEECRIRAETESALKSSEQEYRYLFDSAHDALMLVDPAERIILRVNESWRKMYQYDGQFEPNYPLEKIWPERESFDKLLEMVYQQDEVVRYETTHRTCTYTEIEVSVNARRVTYLKRDAVLCACQDINQQQKIEKLLLSHNILLRVRNLVLVSNAQGHIIYANHAVKEILGYEPQEVLGDQWWKLTRPQDEGEQEKKRIRESAENPMTVSTTPYERWIRDKWGNAHCIIWSDAPAPGNLVIGVGYDITDRIEAQRALEASEQRYRFLFDHIPFPLLMSHLPSYSVVAINQTARQLFGMQNSEDERIRIGEWLAQEPASTDTPQILSYRRPDGTMIDIELESYDFELMQQSYRLSLLTNRSAMEEAQRANQKYQEQKLRLSGVIEALEDERRRMAYELHDGLGQILSGAKRLLEHLSEELALSPESAERMDMIAKMLNNALAETKTIAYNLLPRTLEEYGLYFAVEQLMKQWLSQAGIQFHFQRHNLPERMPYYMELALYRIVQESLNNILKHAHATEVSVQFIGYPSVVVLTIEDNGCGFDPLQVSSGIGLRSIKDRVAYLDGNLHIDSNTGKGTSLIIEIPKRAKV